MASATVHGRTGDDVQRAIDSLPEGGEVKLPAGRYRFERAVVVRRDIRLVGEGPAATQLELAPGSNCHMLVNDPHAGRRSIAIGRLSLHGNMESQERPTEDAFCFACAIFFAGVDGVTVEQVEAYRIRQTGLHFHRCRNVAITGARATDVGWSGISSSQTDDLTLRDVHVRRSGLDTVHSAIHIGGGERIFVEVDADESTGNAVMLDSRAAPLSRAVVMGSGRAAKRGVALIGHDHPLTHVHVTGAYVQNRETGILVSNAEDVYVVGAELVDNPVGVVLQGRRGARRCMVAGCRITGSHVPILERRWNCDNVIIA